MREFIRMHGPHSGVDCNHIQQQGNEDKPVHMMFL